MTTKPEQPRGPSPTPERAVRSPEPVIHEVEPQTQPSHQQDESQNAESMVTEPGERRATSAAVAVVDNDGQQPEVPLVNGTASISEPHPENVADKLEQPAISLGVVQSAAIMDGVIPESAVPASSDTIVAPTDAILEAREWETDSSPYDSSDSDCSTSTDSDDSDEDADAEYSMLDPEEQARILMQDDGGSDDEGGKGKEKGNANMRTANERFEEVIPKPNIDITDDMQIELLGTVAGIVESTVVVKARTTGEYQVLESGSLLCSKDRSVIGVVAETMGRVEQPMYTIRFANDAAIEEAGLSDHGTTVYYVLPHSTFVFTQPLKGLKGSDASNFHDEEVGDEEMEFSDDEKEAEHRRLLKLKRQGRLGREDSGRGSRGGRGRGRGRGRGDFRESNLRHSSVSSTTEPIPDEPSNAALNYDDEPDTDYTPLRRPSQDQQSSMAPPRTNGRGDYGQTRGRGGFRGDRGGRGNHGGRGGRGSYDNYNRQNQQQNQHQQMPPPPPQYYSQPQQTPQLTPQAPFAPFSPSPISPLPGQQFNFAQLTNFPPPPPPPPGWQPPNLNQAAAAQVQRQLQELMRMQQGGQNGYGQGRP